MAKKDFSDRLQAKFADSGMTKAELSRRSGVPYDAINKLLRGDNRTTSPENTAKLASILGSGLAPSGFSEPAGKQPRMNMSSVMADTAPVKNAEGDELNKIRIALVGDRLQVAGTYDRDGIAKLILRLEALAGMMDD